MLHWAEQHRVQMIRLIKKLTGFLKKLTNFF